MPRKKRRKLHARARKRRQIKLSDALALLAGKPKAVLANELHVTPRTFDRWCRWWEAPDGSGTDRLGTLPSKEQLAECWRLANDGFKERRYEVNRSHDEQMAKLHLSRQRNEITAEEWEAAKADYTIRTARQLEELEAVRLDAWQSIHFFWYWKQGERDRRRFQDKARHNAHAAKAATLPFPAGQEGGGAMSGR